MKKQVRKYDYEFSCYSIRSKKVVERFIINRDTVAGAKKFLKHLNTVELYDIDGDGQPERVWRVKRV